MGRAHVKSSSAQNVVVESSDPAVNDRPELIRGVRCLQKPVLAAIVQRVEERKLMFTLLQACDVVMDLIMDSATILILSVVFFLSVAIFYCTKGREREVYALDHALLNIELSSYWLNMGYWEHTDDFRTACEALANKVTNGFVENGDQIMDFGSGCGDQLLLWGKQYQNATIDSVTSEESHVNLSRRRLEDAALSKRIRVFKGDAMSPATWASNDVPEPKFGQYDSVLSLDSCYHYYPSRREFFKLASAFLNSSGKIGLTDIIKGDEGTWLSALILRLFCFAARVPHVNMVTKAQYERDMAGEFTDVQITDITDFFTRDISDSSPGGRVGPNITL
ncbi:hypothetical protein HK101_009774 [Irineochytrium annulatum]|nr:hypothetical protein HK101_009774 [Irineochytrium annulatum]